MGFSCSTHSEFHLGEPDENFCGVLLFLASSAGVRFLLLFPLLFQLWLSAIYNFHHLGLFVCFFLTVQATIF